MTPSLAVIQLSDSFAAAWPDLAEELAVEHTRVEPSSVPGPDTLAVLVAAGGEEHRALDLLGGPLPRAEGVPVFVVGAHPSHRFAAEAVRRGATDYFVLPGDLDLLRRALQSRLEVTRERTRRSGETRSAADPFHQLLGESPALRDTLALARLVLQHGDVTVLLTGETGTGKELLARALHDGSERAGGPFVALNCAAIPANLLESELFGHERGAFTDAYLAKPGLFEEADRGTLFLDEVGHLPLELQGKLLRALEERRVRRVGATRSRSMDVRIVAATNVDLQAAAARGEFREDLFYRLNVVVLRLPPLRERGRDVELLAEAFVVALAGRYGLPVPSLTPDARAALLGHSWPGNVRELRHAIERALLLSERGTLDPARLNTPTPSAPGATSGGTLSEVILATVKTAITRSGGNKSQAARELGISRQRLLRILENADVDGA